MRLRSMTATFGCLEQETLEFDRNMTVLTAPNGTGKSTWCAFLRIMLYGLDSRQRDRKGVPADKNRYRPWSGKPMEGLLLCEYGGELVEIRRTSGHGIPMGDFSARYQESGLPVPGLTGENLGETLLGVGREVFERSAFVRQTGLAVEQSKELEQRMAALVTSGEEETSWTQAAERLKGWQHRRRYHRSGRLPELEQEETALGKTIADTAFLRKELEETEKQEDTLRQQAARWEARIAQETEQFHAEQTRRQAEAAAALAVAEERLGSLTARYEEAQRTAEPGENGQPKQKQGVPRLPMLVLLLATVLAAVSLISRHGGGFQLPTVLMVGVVVLLWLLLLGWKLRTGRQERREQERIQEQTERQRTLCRELSQKVAAAKEEQETAQHRCEQVSRETPPAPSPEAAACREGLERAQRESAMLRGRLSAAGDPAGLDARLDNVREEIRLLQRDYDALEIAQEALKTADSQLHARFSPQLCDRAGAYLEKLTEGRYTGFSLTRELDIFVQEKGDSLPRPISAMSQGIRDQLYLALRLAVADLILPDPDACPLVLDDALCSFDDRRLQLALACLTELSQRRQVLLFTCQKREREALSQQPGVRFCTLERT